MSLEPRNHAAPFRPAPQPAAPAINPGQQVALAGDAGLAQTQTAAVQKAAILPSGMLRTHTIATREIKMASGRVLLASFADGAFSRRRQRFASEAESSKFFDEVHVHSMNTLPSDFLHLHGEFMKSNPRGFGYWIWKPVVLLETLSLADRDDVVIYLDAGFTINPDAGRRFLEYLEITRDSKFGMLSFSNIFTEAHWTKADLATRLGVRQDSIDMRTSQLGSGFIMMRPTRENRELVRIWKEIAVEGGYRYSDDSPSTEPNHPDFREHRHDQSIASLLRKLRGTEITHYEVQAYAGWFDKLKPFLPMWATRSRE
jgi:hypothetical protein